MSIALSIASGHTRSVALLWKSHKLQVATAASLSFHHVDRATIIQRLKGLRKTLGLGNASLPTVITLPGVSHPAHITIASELLKAAGWNPEDCRHIDDTVAGLIAELGTLDGVCAFSGTGASVFVGVGLPVLPSPAVRPYKLDGWGPLLGDRGSGFRLGLGVVRLALKHFDNFGTKPGFYRDFQALEPELEDPANAQNWFDQLLESKSRTRGKQSGLNWNVRIARLAQIVTRRLESLSPEQFDNPGKYNLDHDTCGLISLLIESAVDMAESINSALSQSEECSNRAVPVVCHGGNFRFSEHYLRIVSESVRSLSSRVIRAHRHPVIGGLAVAMSPDMDLPSPEACNELWNEIDASRQLLEKCNVLF